MKWKPRLSIEHDKYRWCNKREALGLNLLIRVKAVLNSSIWDTQSLAVQQGGPASPSYIWAGSLTKAVRQVAAADRLVAKSCNQLYDKMAKDPRYARLEAADTVLRGPDSESVAGIYGAFKMPDGRMELRYFTLSLGVRGKRLRALIQLRDSRVRKAATATDLGELFYWVSETLEQD